MSKIQNLKTEINKKAFSIFDSLCQAVIWAFILYFIYFLFLVPRPKQEIQVKAEVNPTPVMEDKTKVEIPKAQPPVDNGGQKTQEQIWEENINSYIEEYNPNLNNTTCGDASGKIWVEAGKKYKVHPYFLIAIARADTSLGKSLTSPCNLGNVGHCDSCSKGYSYNSFANSIYSISQTISNQYLIVGTKTCHFSVGGWKFCPEAKKLMKGKFYASSKSNWNANVNDTMRWLIGGDYRNDYEVRL